MSFSNNENKDYKKQKTDINTKKQSMSVEAEKVLNKVEKDSEDIQKLLREAAEWFHNREGKFLNRNTALELIEEELNVSRKKAGKIISKLVGDEVDPVIQVNTDDEKFVGIVEYNEFESSYGYIDHDDVAGRIKRVVCARCVQKAEKDSEVTCLTEKAGDSSTDFSRLRNKMKRHFQENHRKPVKKVKTGATLASGTTIGGNISWHSGNDGPGSGLDADTIDGLQPNEIDADKVDGQDANDLGAPNSTQTTAPGGGGWWAWDSDSRTLDYSTEGPWITYTPVSDNFIRGVEIDITDSGTSGYDKCRVSYECFNWRGNKIIDRDSNNDTVHDISKTNKLISSMRWRIQYDGFNDGPLDLAGRIRVNQFKGQSHSHPI